MAAIVAGDSAATEQITFTRPRREPTTPSIPNQKIPSILQSTRRKSSISSLFLSTFANTTMNTNNHSKSGTSSVSSKNKKKNFTSATFRGLGCATSSQVSAPSVIRSSADWQAKKQRKKKQRNPQRKKNNQTMIDTNNPSPVVVIPDVWCSPGLSLTTDAAASVDCVVSRRPVNGSGVVRNRADGERMNHRERSYITRRNAANFEHISVLDSPSGFETSRFGSDVFGGRNYRHFRHRSPGGLAEIMMFQSSLLLEGRSDGYDRYRDWRLDVENMSYEELLELGDRIGYVSTGLGEDEIFRCLRKTKLSILDASPSNFLSEMDWKCSICQEEYKAAEEVGKLDCGHSYHVCCIKQWLLKKNACPVCKVAAAFH